MYALELVGEEDDFAAAEAATVAGAVDVVASGLAVAKGLRTDHVSRLAYTRAASRLVGRTDADVESVLALLSTTALGETDTTVAVRARDVRATAGVSTSRTEREVGTALVERGFSVDLDDPDRELRVSFGDDTALVGWLAAESVRDFGQRAPTDRPFFQPGSMAPLDARAYANLAGAGPGRTVLDPMCGTGGLLIEAGLTGCRVVGVDAQEKMVHGTRENLEAYLGTDFAVVRGDGTTLPVADDAVDGVVVDAPYGRQSKVAGHELDELVAGTLVEAARVASRCVLVGDRDWTRQANDAGWDVRATFARRVHRSLVRHVHLLDRRS